jgi:hypothetical protein
MAYCTIPRIGHSNFLQQVRAATPPPLAEKARVVSLYFRCFQLSSLVTSRDPSSQRWKYVGEKCAGKFSLKLPDFHVAFRGSFTCRKSTTWDPRLYFPSEERRAKDPTASVGFEPAKLSSKGQYATSRPPKPLFVDLGIQHAMIICHIVN